MIVRVRFSTSGCTASRSTHLHCPGAISPTAINEISIINNLALNGARAGAQPVSASTADYNLDDALGLRRLATWINPQTDAALTGNKKHGPAGPPAGLEKVRRSARRQPVAGRADTLTPVNHAGFAPNQAVHRGCAISKSPTGRILMLFWLYAVFQPVLFRCISMPCELLPGRPDSPPTRTRG